MKHNKHSRTLSTVETTTRRQHDLKKVELREPEDPALLAKKKHLYVHGHLSLYF